MAHHNYKRVEMNHHPAVDAASIYRHYLHEDDEVITKNNSQYCSESSSACRGGNVVAQGVGGIMMSEGACGRGGSWSRGQNVPLSLRGDDCSDLGCQPTGDSMNNNSGHCSNFSGPGGSNMGVSKLKKRDGDDNSVNYPAARAHAAQMLAAEESRRLEENLMMLEMHQRMMRGGDDSAPADMDDKEMSANQVQASSSGSSGTGSKCNDSISDPAMTQKFSLPQNQKMNMMGRNTNNSLHRSADNAGNARTFLKCPSPNNNMPTLAPLKPVEVMKSCGVAATGQVSHSYQSTTKQADPPQDLKATDAPRRPLSAYNIFFSEMREIILKEKEDGDETSSEEKSKIDVSEAKKGNAEEEKGKEMKDMDAFVQNLMKKRLDKKPAKRVHRKSHGKVAFTTLAKTVGQRWRELPQYEKKKYKELAEVDQARYREEKLAMKKALREKAKKQRKEAKARQKKVS